MPMPPPLAPPPMYRVLRAVAAWLARRDLRFVHGLEFVPKDRAFILAANHVSWLDPIYLVAALYGHVQGRIMFVGATKKHTWTQGVIPIDPSDRAQCISIAEQHLSSGEVVGIFPTGDQRKYEREGHHVRTGVVRLALNSGMPIVPALLSNITTGHTWRSLVAYLVKPASIDIRFGEPFFLSPTQEPSAESLQTMAREVFSRIQKLAS